VPSYSNCRGATVIQECRGAYRYVSAANPRSSIIAASHLLIWLHRVPGVDVDINKRF